MKIKLSTLIVTIILILALTAGVTLLLTNKDFGLMKTTKNDNGIEIESEQNTTVTEEKITEEIKEKEITNRAKEVFKEFFSNIQKAQSVPRELLMDLKLVTYNQQTNDWAEFKNWELDENYIKTDVNYSEFKGKLLECMTEEMFTTYFSENYKNDNGILCVKEFDVYDWYEIKEFAFVSKNKENEYIYETTYELNSSMQNGNFKVKANVTIKIEDGEYKVSKFEIIKQEKISDYSGV